MKVALIHYRIAHAGGLERRLLNYMHYFLQRGDEVTIFYARREANVSLPDTVNLRHIPIRHYPKPFRMGAFGRRVRRALLSSNYDFSLSLGRTPGAQLLICPGNHRGFLHHMERPWRYTDAIESALDVKSFRTAKHILAASNMVKLELLDWYDAPKAKVTVLYPPTDTDRFNPILKADQVALQKRAGMSPTEKNFLFVSYSHRRKGLAILLAAFEEMQGEKVHLYIAGEKPTQKLPDNCTYLKFVHNMPALYAAADVLVHPAYYEPFGQIVTESLQCGTPVLVSATTGAGELLCPDEGMVVPNQQVITWVEYCRKIVAYNLEVPPNFAQRNGLTLAQHMEAMLAVWNTIAHP